MTIIRLSRGVTRRVFLEDGRGMYITVNWTADGEPLEVFIRLDDPALFEWLTVLTRFISMALRESVPLELITKELEQIASPATQHMVPGTDELCPSLAARIGREIRHAYEAGPGMALALYGDLSDDKTD